MLIIKKYTMVLCYYITFKLIVITELIITESLFPS